MAYKALYRAYRPFRFDDVIGQEVIIKTLRAQTASGRIAHAYLFTGPRGTGKTSVAKIFARAINCSSPIDGDACGQCEACSELKGPSMDIIEMDAASNNGVDEVRAIKDNIVFPPQTGKYKVYIIDEVHMLSGGAFNALLKTLEEPPEHAVFILATTEAHKLPATILSRCQRFNFKNISTEAIAKRLKSILELQGVNADADAVELLARTAEGGMRDALSLADMCISYCGDTISYQDVVGILGTADRQFLFEVLDMLAERNRAALIEAVDRLIRDGRDAGVFIKDLIAHISDLMAIKAAPESIRFENFGAEVKKDMTAQAQRIGDELLLRSAEILNGAEAAMRASTRPRVVLETALLRICSPCLESDDIALLDRIAALEQQLSHIKREGITPPKENIPEQTAAPIQQKPQKQAEKSEKKSAEPSKSAAAASDLSGDELWEALLVRLRKSNPLLYSAVKEAEGGELLGGAYTITFPAGTDSKLAFAKKKQELIATELSALVEGKPAVLFETGGAPPDDTEAFKQRAIDLFGEDNIKFT